MKTKQFRFVALLLALSASASYAETFMGIGLPAAKGKFALLSFQNFISGPVGSGSPYPASFVTITPSYYTERGFTKDRDQFHFFAGAAVGYVEGFAPPGTSTWDRIGWGLPHVGLEWYFNAVRPTPISNKPGAAKASWWFSPYAFVYLPNGSTKGTDVNVTPHIPWGFDGFYGNRVGFEIALANNIMVGNFWASVIPLRFHYNGPYLHRLSAQNNKEQLDIDLLDFTAGYALHPTFYIGIHHIYSFKNVTVDAAKQWGEGRIGPSITWLGLASKGFFFFANVNFTYVLTNPSAYPPLAQKTTSINGCMLYVF